MEREGRLTIFVSSAVYGNEALLSSIFSILDSFGYEVWMSCKQTVPVHPRRTNLENCLEATRTCDLFLGLITPSYGSGKGDTKDDPYITHKELKKAIELDKLRWFLVHDNVVFARSLLINLGYDTSEKRSQLKLKKSQIFGDLRIIDMYEEAKGDYSGLPSSKKAGFWVQTYEDDKAAIRYITTQLSDYDKWKTFIRGDGGRS